MAAARPLVTIGVPTRNSARYIRGMLGSLESQDYPRDLMEVVFVDGLSDDGTYEIIREWAGTGGRGFRRVVVIRERSNVSRARNLVLSEAQGDYVLFWDSDVVAPTNAVSELVGFMESHREVGLAGLPYWSDRPRLVDRVMMAEVGEGAVEVTGLRMGMTIIRRGVFERVRFDESLSFYEGVEYSFRARRLGYKIVLLPLRCTHLKTDERGPLTQLADYLRAIYRTDAFYKMIKGGSRRCLFRAVFYWGLLASLPLSLLNPLFLGYLALPFAVQIVRRRSLHRGLVMGALTTVTGVAMAASVVRSAFREAFLGGYKHSVGKQ